MKLKLFKVDRINSTIKNIINNKDYKIDVVTKFQMLGILKTFESSIMNIEVIKNEKIMEYGTENENGMFSIDKDDFENMSKFITDMNELMNSDVEIDVELLDAKFISNIGLSADELMVLYDIMELK